MRGRLVFLFIRACFYSAQLRFQPVSALLDWLRTFLKCVPCLPYRVNESCVIIRGAAFCLLIGCCTKTGHFWIALFYCAEIVALSFTRWCWSACRECAFVIFLFYSLISGVLAAVVSLIIHNVHLQMSFLLGHHYIFWPHEDPRTASPHDRKRSFRQVPVPKTTLFVPAQYGGRPSHTEQQLRPLPGEDPYRREKSSQSQHSLL